MYVMKEFFFYIMLFFKNSVFFLITIICLSGLDDSRNTARLAWRMICDGCVMKITKSLDKVSWFFRSPFFLQSVQHDI